MGIEPPHSPPLLGTTVSIEAIVFHSTIRG